MKINKRKKYIIILFVLLLGLSVGFALLQANLKINGTSKVKNSTWDIHFENLNITNGSVEIGTGDVAAAIQSSTTDITYTVTLNFPGDYYEFTVDAVNAGSVDGMIESVTSKLNNQPITTLPAYLNYSVTYSDGVALSPNQYLKAGDSETYKVRVEFKRDIESTDLPATAQTLTFNFGVVYVQADDNAVKVPHAENFATDDWDLVINTLKTGNIAPYEVGDEKEVDLGTFGVHKLRIANSTTPTECSTEGFSQTACGIVLEFVDIVTKHFMNTPNSNAGGWPASELRTYINTDIYNALPEALKNAIIDTKVVSGHGCINYAYYACRDTGLEENFISTDKLYLLSTHEVWEDVDSNTSEGIDFIDTAYHNTRQLDYYKKLNITTSNYDGARKFSIETDYYHWFLRTPHKKLTSSFYNVTFSGSATTYPANSLHGVSPAFRIG